MKKKLRVGFFIPRNRTVTSWQNEIIQNLEMLPYVEIAFFATENIENRKPFLTRLLRKSRNIPWFLINHAEKKVATLFLNMPKVDTPCNIEHLSSRYPFVEVGAVRKNYPFDYLTEDSLRELEQYKPAIIIHFAFNILKGEILTLPKYGVWSYQHGDNRINRGGPPGFWEWYLNQHTTGVTLQKLADALDNGPVLARMTLQTYKFSWNKNRALAYKKSVPLVTDAIARYADSARKLEDTGKSNDFFSNVYSGPLFVAPSPIQVFYACMKWIGRATRHILRTIIFRDQWFVFVSDERTNQNLVRKYRKLTPPRGAYWADPFVLQTPDNKDDDIFVSVEELNVRTGKGHISILRLSGDHVSESVPVIFGEYHYSYPFVFLHEEAFWMIP